MASKKLKLAHLPAKFHLTRIKAANTNQDQSESPIETTAQDSAPEMSSSEPDRQERSVHLWFWIGSAVLAIILISTGWIFWYYQKSTSSPVEPEVKQVQTPAVPVVVTPTFDRSKISFEVLNGSGLAGTAQKNSIILQSLGYKVLKVGNSSTIIKGKHQLYLSEGARGQSQQILEDLADKIGEATLSGVLKDSTTSARLIIAK